MADMTTVEIKVARIITESGKLAVRITLPAEFSSIEVLGLMEVAKGWILREMRDE